MRENTPIMKRLINEELNKSDVRSITKGELSAFVKQSEFKNAVKDITADALKNLYKALFQNTNFWQSQVKH